MSKADKNYRKGLKKYIEAQKLLIRSISIDVLRNQEDINLENKRMSINLQRLKIENESLKIAQENLKAEL